MDIFEKKRVMVVFRAALAGIPVVLRGHECYFDGDGLFGYDARPFSSAQEVPEDFGQLESGRVVLDWTLGEFVEAARGVGVEEVVRLQERTPPYPRDGVKKGEGGFARTENL